MDLDSESNPNGSYFNLDNDSDSIPNLPLQPDINKPDADGDGDGDGDDDGDADCDDDGDGDIDSAPTQTPTPTPTPPPPPPPSTTTTTTTTTKGFGLKKWRRIPRGIQTITSTTTTHLNVDLDADADADILKSKSKRASSSNILDHVSDFDTNTITIFRCSDNSDDRSSTTKSSTAATAPKHHHHHHRHHRSSSSRSPRTKLLIDATKKHRGGEIEKLTSPHSTPSTSVEKLTSPHSTPSTSVFLTNQPHAASPSPQGFESQCFSEDTQNSDSDPLLHSIRMLHSAQLALQREVQKFGEMGKGIRILCEDSTDTAGGAYSASLGSEICRECPSDGWASKFGHVYLNENVQTLERWLGETKNELKAKELKIAELEATIENMESRQKDMGNTFDLQLQRCIVMEAELESLFKQKLESEIEYLAITRSTKEFSILVEDHIKLLKERKYLGREQFQSPRTMTDDETNTVMLQTQVEKVDGEMAAGEEIMKMRRRVVQSAKCFAIQFVLLAFVFGIIVLQLLPKSSVVVPT